MSFKTETLLTLTLLFATLSAIFGVIAVIAAFISMCWVVP